LPSRTQLFGDRTEIQQLNRFGRPERVGDSAEEDRAAPLRPGVCSGPLQSHKSYGGVGRRRVVPQLTGEFNFSVPRRAPQAATSAPASLQGTSCIVDSGQSLLIKER
jgi:hypothetical protein